MTGPWFIEPNAIIRLCQNESIDYTIASYVRAASTILINLNANLRNPIYADNL